MLRDSEDSRKVLASWVRCFEEIHVTLGKYIQTMYDAENQKEFLNVEFDVDTSKREFTLQKKLSYRHHQINLTIPVQLTPTQDFKTMAAFLHEIFDVSG